jgi:hypothetical protein
MLSRDAEREIAARVDIGRKLERRNRTSFAPRLHGRRHAEHYRASLRCRERQRDRRVDLRSYRF